MEKDQKNLISVELGRVDSLSGQLLEVRITESQFPSELKELELNGLGLKMLIAMRNVA